jgi:PAS domain S-box-containing protein
MSIEYVLVLGFSVLVQLIAGLLALRLVWVTQAGKSWALIAAAILWMSFRRCVELIGVLTGGSFLGAKSDIVIEINAIIISVLMLSGIIGIAPLFRGARQSAVSLYESQRKLYTLMENLPGMAYRCLNDKDWTMEFVSQGCNRLTGYQPEDIIGNRVKAYNDLIHPDDRQQVWDRVQAVLPERRPFQLSYRIITASGAEKWVWEQGRGVYSSSGELLALEGFIADDTERHRAEELMLAEKNARKEQKRLRQLLHLQERQSHLMAYDIHDGLAQKLTGAMMYLQVLDQPKFGISENARGTYQTAVQLLQDAMTETRRLIAGLRPPILEESGLVAAIEYLISETSRRSEVEVEFQNDVQIERFDPLLETTAFRIVQECLTNICQHSQSKKARIAVVRHGDNLHIEAEDWGRGFDPSQIPSDHYGIEGILQRSRLFGGRATIDSSPGKGARIVVDLPLVEA